MNKKIIFACTSGIATSAVATEKVVQYCKSQGINVEPIQSNIGTIGKQGWDGGSHYRDICG